MKKKLDITLKVCIVRIVGLNAVDKDYVQWLDDKEAQRANPQPGKGDDIRPYGKIAYDAGYERIYGTKDCGVAKSGKASVS